MESGDQFEGFFGLQIEQVRDVLKVAWTLVLDDEPLGCVLLQLVHGGADVGTVLHGAGIDADV